MEFQQSWMNRSLNLVTLVGVAGSMETRSLPKVISNNLRCGVDNRIRKSIDPQEKERNYLCVGVFL